MAECERYGEVEEKEGSFEPMQGRYGLAFRPSRSIRLPNDIEFSGERKRVRCNEGLGCDIWRETRRIGGAIKKPEYDRKCRIRGGHEHNYQHPVLWLAKPECAG